jgi:DNA-binding GntR family transcriptional regulator
MKKVTAETASLRPTVDESPGRGVVRPSALVDEVYEAILDRIMGLHIQPGSKITVDNLARELGVSQTPIREALSRLEAEGLVLKTHLIGYSAAAQLSRKQVEELFELRLLLEPAAAAKAASQINDERHQELRALQAGMVSLRDNQFPAYGQFARKDAEFHSLIAAASGNALLADALSKLHTHVHIFRLVFHARVTSEAIAEHNQVLVALGKGASLDSERAMRAHVLASQDRILTLVPSLV